MDVKKDANTTTTNSTNGDNSCDSDKVDKSYNTELEFKGIFDEDVLIKEAKKYELTLQKDIGIDEFFAYVSGIAKPKENSIFVNGLEINKDITAKKYLQQNSLLLSVDSFLMNLFSIEDQLKAVSFLQCGFDLSHATLSTFSLKEFAHLDIGEKLTTTERRFVLLTYVVACPCLIWFIDTRLLVGISKEHRELFDNAVNIRIKHGGAVIFVK